MALSILSYNLPQGLKMSANIKSSSSNNNNNNNNNNGSPPTGDENSSQSGRTTINIGKSFSRITMQNVLSESSSNVLNISNNSNVNTIVRKIKDIGMYGSVNNAGALSATISARKRTNSETRTPTSKTNSNEKKAEEEVKQPIKRAKKKDENVREKSQNVTSNKSAATTPTSNRPKVANTPGAKKPAGTPGRKGLPLPQAVARRNARERNRVKQVNNGFAALRQRIPEEVAEAFEAQGNGRGTVKKLSKVETLRMAVEYIRSLEHLLGFDFTPGCDRGITLLQASSSSDDSFTFIKDEFDALSSPPLDDTAFDDSLSNYDVDEYLNSTSDFGTQSMISQQSPPVGTTDASAYEMDLLPSLTTINGLQYVRIAGTNTYQLLTPDMLFMHANAAPHSPPTSSLDEESFQNLIDTNCLSPVTTTSPTTHISPASINSVINSNATPAATTLQQQQYSDRAPSANGEIVDECVNILSTRSSVQSTPTVHTSLHQKQQQQQQQQRIHHRQPQTPTQRSSSLSSSSNLSPAADNDTILLRKCAPTCATNVDEDNDDHDEIDGYVERNTRQRFVALPTPITLSQKQPSHATIKQEFNDTLTDDLALGNGTVPAAAAANVTPSPTDNLSASAMLVFQQQLQERLLFSQTSLSQTTTTMSPPPRIIPTTPTTTTATAYDTPATPTMLYVPQSTATTPTTPGLSSFYNGEQDNSYFEGSHIILKKEYNDALLQASAAAQAAAEQNAFGGLPDENIIEVMDWWDAHTPKSDSSVTLI